MTKLKNLNCDKVKKKNQTVTKLDQSNSDGSNSDIF